MTHTGTPISQTQQLSQMSNLQPTQSVKLEENTTPARLIDEAINSASQEKVAAERERQRQREQERRRREAVGLTALVLFNEEHRVVELLTDNFARFYQKYRVRLENPQLLG